MVDPVGVALGIVGLYGTRVGVLDRIGAYKNCGPDSRAAMARFHGTKLRLMTWAEAVAFGKAD